MSSGTVVGLAVGVLALPALSRLYTPESFGVYAVFLSVLSPILAVSALRYDLAIPVPRSDWEALRLLALSLLSAGAVAALLMVAMLLGGNQLWVLLRIPEMTPWAWALVPGVIAGGTYQILSFWSTRQGQFGLIGRTKMTQALGGLAVQLLGGVLGGAGGLVAGEVVGRGAGSLTLGRANWRRLRVLARVKWSEMRVAAERYRAYPAYAAPSALLAFASVQALPLVFAFFYNVEVAGQFAIASKVLLVPSMLIGRAVSQVFLRSAAQEVLRGEGALWRLYRGVLLKLLLVGLGPFLVVAIFAVPAFPLIFGEAWRAAGWFTTILAAASFAQFVVSPLTHALVVLGRQRLHLGWDFARFILMAATVVVGDVLGWGPLSMAGALSMSIVISYVGHVVLTRAVISPSS